MQENSTIKANILKFLDYKGITAYKFYKETGISRGILTQKNGMSEDNTLRFLDYYPEVSPSWLLTGEGEMLKSNAGVSNNESEVAALKKEVAELQKENNQLKDDLITCLQGALGARKSKAG